MRLTGTEEDALVTATLTAAVSKIEDETRRAIMPQVWEAAFAGSWPANTPVLLPRPRVMQVNSLLYTDTNGGQKPWLSWASQDLAEPAAVWLKDAPADVAAPAHDQDAVWRVNYQAGYATAAAVPGALLAAIKLLAAHLFEKREATISGTMISEVPLGVRYLLDPYRVPWGGPNL